MPGLSPLLPPGLPEPLPEPETGQLGSLRQCPCSPQAAQWDCFFRSSMLCFGPENFLPSFTPCRRLVATVKTLAASMTAFAMSSLLPSSSSSSARARGRHRPGPRLRRSAPRPPRECPPGSRRHWCQHRPPSLPQRLGWLVVVGRLLSCPYPCPCPPGGPCCRLLTTAAPAGGALCRTPGRKSQEVLGDDQETGAARPP